MWRSDDDILNQVVARAGILRARRRAVAVAALALVVGMIGVSAAASRPGGRDLSDVQVEVAAPVLTTTTALAFAPTPELPPGFIDSVPTTVAPSPATVPPPSITLPPTTLPTVEDEFRFDTCTPEDFALSVTPIQPVFAVGELIQARSTLVNLSDKYCAFVKDRSVEWYAAGASTPLVAGIVVVAADCIVESLECAFSPGQVSEVLHCWDQTIHQGALLESAEAGSYTVGVRYGPPPIGLGPGPPDRWASAEFEISAEVTPPPTTTPPDCTRWP